MPPEQRVPEEGETDKEEREEWTGPADIAWCPEHGLHGARDTCFECGKPVKQIRMIPVGEHDAHRYPRAVAKKYGGCSRCANPQPESGSGEEGERSPFEHREKAAAAAALAIEADSNDEGSWERVATVALQAAEPHLQRMYLERFIQTMQSKPVVDAAQGTYDAQYLHGSEGNEGKALIEAISKETSWQLRD